MQPTVAFAPPWNMKVTTKTPEQIAADFEAEFKDVQPLASARPVTQEDRLAPYRKEILKQRRRGLSWRQIAEVMSRPRIGEKVSGRTLGRIFGDKRSKEEPLKRLILDRATGKPIQPQTATPDEEPRDRLILDRATGKPINVQRPTTRA